MRPSSLKRAGLAMMVLCGLGCSAAKRAPDRTHVSAALLERTGVDATTLPSASEWTAPPGTSLDDGLSYDEAVAIALWNSPDFQAALTSLGLARADLVEAGLLRNPILSLLFPWGPKQLEFTLGLPLEVFWQRPRRIAEAGFKADVVAEQLVGHGVHLIAEVRVAFLEVRSADEALSLAEEQHLAARKLVEIAEARLRAGDISELDTHLARADAARLETAWLARRAARDIASVRLRSLLGLAEDSRPLRLAASEDTPAPGCDEDLPSLVKSALALRPDVRAAEIGVEAAGARVGLEKTKTFTLSALLDANAEGTEGRELGPGILLEIPLLSQNQGGRARAAAELEQAGRRYLAVRSAAARDIQTAYARLIEAKATESALGRTAEPERALAPTQAERAFDAGEISLLSLLEIRQRLLTNDLARLDAGLATSRAVVRLEEAAGGRCGTQTHELER